MVGIWYLVHYVINRCGTTYMWEIWYIYRGLVTILLWSYYSADVYSIARAYAHLERYRRLQSIWYCCWYSMINYYDLCYRFLVSLKPPTRCNIKVVWWAPPTILVLMCISTTPDSYYTTVSTSISRQTLQLIKIISATVLDDLWDGDMVSYSI